MQEIRQSTEIKVRIGCAMDAADGVSLIVKDRRSCVGDQNPNYRGGEVEKKCLVCGNVFYVRLHRAKSAKCCSIKCSSLLHRERMKGENNPSWNGGGISIKCPVCEKVFNIKKAEIGRRKYCSKKCMAEDYSTRLIGDGNPHWKNAASEERVVWRRNGGELWRKSVLKRDNYTCQECGDATGGNLNAHHILPYRDWKDLQYSLNIMNGITLCEECHKKTYWKEYEFFDKYFDIANGVDV